MIAESPLQLVSDDAVVNVDPPGADDIDRNARQAQVQRLPAISDPILSKLVRAAKQDVVRYPNTAKPLVDLGRSFLNAGQEDDGESALLQALEIDPSHRQAKQLLAQLSLQRANLVRARQLWDELLRSDASDIQALLGLAQVAAASGDLEDAKRSCLEALDIDRTYGPAYLLLGRVLVHIQSLDAAIAAYRMATRLCVRPANAYFQLGVAYSLKGQQKQSARALRTSIALEPKMESAVKVLSRLLLHGPSLEGVIDLLSERVERVGSDYEARDLLAIAYLRHGDYRSARRQLINAYHTAVQDPARTGPALARIANNLGVCYGLMKDEEKALQFYQVSVRHCADCGPIGFQNLARTRLRLWQLPEASTTLTEALHRYGTDRKLRLLLGFRFYAEASFDKAIQCFRELSLEPGAEWEVFELLGSSLSDGKRQYDAAIEVLRAAEARWGMNLALANGLAYAYIMAGDLDAAGRVLDQHFDDEASSVTMRATRALLELRRGDMDAGRAGYLEAITIAREQGNQMLRDLATQKMHLELARALRARGDVEAAASEVQLGLAIRARWIVYQRDLQELAVDLKRDSAGATARVSGHEL